MRKIRRQKTSTLKMTYIISSSIVSIFALIGVFFGKEGITSFFTGIGITVMIIMFGYFLTLGN